MNAPEAFLTAACPQCGATYQVPLAKIGPKGRKLKCAKCEHLWVVAAPAPEESATPPPAEPVAVAPAAEPVAETSTAVPEPTPEPIPAAPEPEASPPAPLIAPLALTELTKPAWHSYVVGEQKWLTLALLLTGLGVVAAGLALWQQLQPPPTPSTVPLYQAPERPQLQVVAPPLGVVLHGVQGLTAESPSGTVLTVQGSVVNTSSNTAVLPILRAELVDDAGALQDFQAVTLVTGTLPGGLMQDFAVSFTNPLGAAWQLNWVGPAN